MVFTDQNEAALNQMKHGRKIDHPLGTVTKNEFLKIENGSIIFCGITGFVNFWLQYLLLIEKLLKIVRQ